MVLRDILSTVVATALLLAVVFGALYFVSTEFFAPSTKSQAEGRATPTATAIRLAAALATSEPERGATPANGAAATETPTAAATNVAATATSASTSTPSGTSTPAATPTRAVTQIPQPAATARLGATPQPAAQAASFGGNWRVVDSVTEGDGAGQTFTFDITLAQTGNRLSGGNGGIIIEGTVSGSTATASYTQQALNLTGSFTWTLGANGNAAGSFTSSVPNSGTSQLIRK